MTCGVAAGEAKPAASTMVKSRRKMCGRSASTISSVTGTSRVSALWRKKTERPVKAGSPAKSRPKSALSNDDFPAPVSPSVTK